MHIDVTLKHRLSCNSSDVITSALFMSRCCKNEVFDPKATFNLAYKTKCVAIFVFTRLKYKKKLKIYMIPLVACMTLVSYRELPELGV